MFFTGEDSMSKTKTIKKKDKKSKNGNPKDENPKDENPKDGNPKDGNPKDKNTEDKWLPRVQFIVAIFFGLVTAIIGIISICIMCNISKTTNLLYIQNAIQQRTDAVLSAMDELSTARRQHPNPSEKEERDIREKEKDETDAIYAFLKTYDFACLQYIDGKIDRKVFKLLYKDGTVKILVDRYKNFGGETRKSIEKVNKEWSR
jgi:hypothetical protein